MNPDYFKVKNSELITQSPPTEGTLSAFLDLSRSGLDNHVVNRCKCPLLEEIEKQLVIYETLVIELTEHALLVFEALKVGFLSL